MKFGMSVDTSGIDAALKKVVLNQTDMLSVAGAGAKQIVNKQRDLVPVDTGDTRASVGSHIVESSATRVVDDVGPETEYAPNIEYGRQDMPNYPIQPFVRPSVFSNAKNVYSAISAVFTDIVRARWQK